MPKLPTKPAVRPAPKPKPKSNLAGYAVLGVGALALVHVYRSSPDLTSEDLDAVMKAGLCLSAGAIVTMGVCALGILNAGVCGFLRNANSA